MPGDRTYFVLMRLKKISVIFMLLMLFASQVILSQDTLSVKKPSGKESEEKETIDTLSVDTLVVTELHESGKRKKTTVIDVANDSTAVTAVAKPKRKGDTMKATMMSAVFPGGGQIFNRKYWKLPIVYVGFGALIYSFSSNSNDYQMYYKGYMDFTDDIKETNSYLEFVPADPAIYDPMVNPNADPANTALVEEKMLRLIDYHKRYRDLSIILTGVWYMIQILDANVDASLLDYDVSDNLDLTFFPSMLTLPGRSPGASLNLQLTMAF